MATIMILPTTDPLSSPTNQSGQSEREVVRFPILCIGLTNILLDNFPIVNNTILHYRTPLHLASASGHFEAVQYLIQQGASVHARDRSGQTPLDDAVHFKRLSVIRLLRETGAHLLLKPAKIGMLLCK